MTKKVALPVFDAPTIERARQKLGGPAASDPRTGDVVRDPAGTVGVIIHAKGGELDVVIGAEGVVRRTTTVAWTAHSPTPDALALVAGDVAAFARLAVGDRVRFRIRGAIAGEGTLFEKCRYGALVAKDDRTIVAVGFRSLEKAVLS